MRDRLIELLNKKYDHFCEQCGVNKDSHYTENLADYLLGNGVIVLPCKVGEIVWVNTEYGTIKARINDIQLIGNTYIVRLYYDLSYCYKENINSYGRVGYKEDKFEFGKTVFHTKEEAEQAMKGGVE